jgi:hypothetical protein|eukprot:COSAG01_NODE_29414_length_638_cov_0.905380_2_plen_108_part_00
MLKKKLLLVNFPRLAAAGRESSRGGGADSGSQFRAIFREAELSDAIIFFDECESVFARRAAGGSSELTELLTVSGTELTPRRHSPAPGQKSGGPAHPNVKRALGGVR